MRQDYCCWLKEEEGFVVDRWWGLGVEDRAMVEGVGLPLEERSFPKYFSDRMFIS